MRILVDAKIPHVAGSLGRLGEVVPFDPPRPPSAALSSAGALVVRSVTRVDAELLDGAPNLRFVGSATAGVDHVDRPELARRGIRFDHAPGANARAVAEYVLAVVMRAGVERDATVGVVGFGQVGRRVAALLRALGYSVLANDPPLNRSRVAGSWSGDEPLVDLDRIIGEARVVTVHVPLTTQGSDATAGLLGPERLSAMDPETLVINTARGGVVDEEALLRAGLRCALDVYEGEPALAWERILALAGRAVVLTPHVAGYTVEAKTRCTRMIHGALARFLGVSDPWTGPPQTVPIPVELEPEETLGAVLERVRGLDALDGAMRQVLTASGDRATAYEALRRTAGRHELHGHAFVGGSGAVRVSLSALEAALPPEL